MRATRKDFDITDLQATQSFVLATRPDGQPRRRLDTTKAEGKFRFKAQVELEEGLQRTISWYTEQQEKHQESS